ncbi:MAG: hypothetical protein ACJ8KO_14360, partial [Sulfurifustaceae bacterium]
KWDVAASPARVPVDVLGVAVGDFAAAALASVPWRTSSDEMFALNETIKGLSEKVRFMGSFNSRAGACSRSL